MDKKKQQMIDRFYRIFTDNGLMWFGIGIVLIGMSAFVFYASFKFISEDCGDDCEDNCRRPRLKERYRMELEKAKQQEEEQKNEKKGGSKKSKNKKKKRKVD